MWKFLALAIITAFVANTTKHLIDLGYFKVLHNHLPGECRTFQIPGAEDIALVPNGQAIITSGLKYVIGDAVDPHMYQRPSAIYRFDFNHPEKGPQKVEIQGLDTTEFNPHGISHYEDPETKKVSICIINHSHAGQKAVEIFDLDSESLTLKLRRTIIDPKIYNPNNLVATGPESFYLTNDHYFSSRHFALLEMLLRLPLGEIIYFDGQTARAVASSYSFPNGINISPNGKFVYLASASCHGVCILQRETNNDLTEIQKIPTGSYVDNINVDPVTGDLWLGGIPKALQAMDYARDFKSAPVASQVIHIKLSQPPSGGPFTYKSREPFLDDGSVLNMSSSACFYNNQLLIGGVFENLAYCKVRSY